MYISEIHEKHLDEDYFPLVAQLRRIPRYVNKRILDPQVKMFFDESNIQLSKEWDLPVPNSEASYKSLAKYAKMLPSLSNGEISNLNRAWMYTRRQFSTYMTNSRVLNYDEAKSHFDMTTSNGSPFNVHYKTKAELFKNDPNIDTWLQHDWDNMDLDWTCLFTNALKEEIRAAEKIAQNSQRTFLVGGLDAVAHGTRLFVDMNEKMYGSVLVTASAVGLSPYYGQWDNLYNKLKIFRNGYALDESQYDSSLRCYMLWSCATLRWSFLAPQFQTPENKIRIQVYYRNLINTLVVGPDGVLILKKGGNPSGSVNTIVDNTLILYTLLAFAWIENAPNDMVSYEDFELHTSKALVGDDNTWTVSDEAHSFFNGRSVITTWKKLGITTTTESLEPRHPRELDFLSAHTVFIQGTAVPIYERSKMMTSLIYATKINLNPAVSLERATGLLSVGWVDYRFRKICQSFIAWLLEKYDKVMANEQKWIMAKAQIVDDYTHQQRFVGNKLVPQGISGEFLKLTQPDKITMSSLKKTKVGRKRNARKPRQIARQSASVQPKRKNPQRKKRNQRGRGNRPLTMQQNPATSQRTKRMVTVAQDEFIGAINGSVDFVNTSYSINPGQAATFPWLSQQAKQWEKYRFEMLEFYYKHEVSEFALNGTTGKIIFGVDFDASDAPPSTKQQIEDTDPRVDTMPCKDLKLTLRSNDMHSLYKTLYVRPGGVPGSADIKTYDAGNLNVATQGNQNTSEIGELRVRYRVCFTVPVLESLTSVPRNYNVSNFQTTTGANLTSGAARTINCSTINFNGLNIVNNAGVMIVPVGRYLVFGTVEINTDATTLVTAYSSGIYRDGTLLYQQNNLNNIWGAGAIISLSAAPAVFESTGETTLELKGTATFTTSTATIIGSILIFAI